MKSKLLAGIATALFLLSPSITNATAVGQPVPKGTNVLGTIYWNPTLNGTGGYVFTPNVTTNGTQVAFGGAVDSASRVNVNPQGASESGMTVTMPSGATGYYLRGFNSTGTLTWNIPASGAPDFPGTGAYSEAVGNGAISTGQFSTVFGNGGASAKGNYAVAIGRGASADASGGVSIGLSSSATGSYGVAVGYTANATGGFTFALGQGAAAPYNADVVIGSTRATAANQMVIGATAPGYQVNDIYIGNGVTSTSPVSSVYNGTGGSGTDIAGGNLTFAGGKSTGAGTGGKVYLATSSPSTTGTTLNTLTNRVQVDNTGINLLSGTYQANGTAGYTGNVNGTTFTGGIATAYNLNGASVSGPVNAAIASTATYSIVPNVDRFEIANAAPNSVSFTLPDPTNYSGPEIDLSRNDTSVTNVVTINTAGTSKTITGYTSVTAQYQVRHCVRLADGSGWFVF